MMQRMARSSSLSKSLSNHHRLGGSAAVPFLPFYDRKPLLEASGQCVPDSFSPPFTSSPNYSTSPMSNSLPARSGRSAQLGNRIGDHRGFCKGSVDYRKEVDEINLKFAEAREEIDAALDSKETVYFDEEVECAREAVKVVLDMFEGLLVRLPENDRAALHRSMGLKMHQLKAELQQLND